MADPSEVLHGKVLVVDDRPDRLLVLERMLLRAGYTSVASTLDPRKTRELHLENRYDLIVIDLEMAATDGLLVMESLKDVETEGGLPVLVLSSEADRLRRALEAGARDFLGKPFTEVEALTRIRNLLEAGLLRRESRSYGELLEQTSVSVREGEARLASVVGSAMDAIITVDAGQRVVVFNAAAERMFRCSREVVMGRPLDALIPSRFRDGHRHHVERFGATGVTSRSMGALGAISGLRANGEEFPIEASISQVEVAGQTLYTVILRDVTERRRAEQEIRSLNAELEERVRLRTVELEAANQDLEAFTYSVSHDLRAPLRTVDGFSQAVLEDFGPQLPEEGQRLLRTIRAGAQRMGGLIDDLLAFSRLGRQSLSKPVVTDMTELVRQAVEELGPEREGRKVDLRIAELAPAAGDLLLIKQVWVNLLSNALKYTRNRETAIVEIGSTVEEGENVYFVRDNGTGFDMRYAKKLFGVFQRLPRSEDFEGTGVGLAIAQRIVQRHGGRIWAVAAVEQGATFRFTLPKGAGS
ncbi:MAG TPA: ATP-binding protein [Vicinamibacteria bacterium]